MSDFWTLTNDQAKEQLSNPQKKPSLWNPDPIPAPAAPQFPDRAIAPKMPEQYYQAFSTAIQNSPDPKATEDKLNSAYYLSRMYGVDFEDAVTNFDPIVKGIYNKAMAPRDAFEALRNVYTASTLNLQISTLAYDMMKRDVDPMKDPNDASWKKIQALEAQMPPADDVKRGLPFKIAQFALQVLPSQIESFKAGALGSLAGGLAGTAVGSLAMAGATVLAPATGGMSYIPAAALASLGAYFGGQVQGLLKNNELEAGSVYYSLMKYRDPTTGEMINPEIAKLASSGYGFASSLVEMVQFDALLKKVPGIDDATKKLLGAAAQETLKDTSATAARAAAVDRAFGNWFKTALTDTADKVLDVGSNTLQEVIQEIESITAEQLARSITNRVDDTHLSPMKKQEIVDRLVETAIGSAAGFSLMPAVTGSMKLLYNAAEQTGKAQAEIRTIKPASPVNEEISTQIYDNFSSKAAGPLPSGMTFGRTEQIPGERYTYKIGDSKGKRLESATVDIQTNDEGPIPGTVTIQGFEKEEDPKIARALLTRISAEYAGWDVQIEPKTPFEQALQRFMVESNPRGKEGGLQWYPTVQDIPKQASMESLKTQLKAQKPGWSEQDVTAATYALPAFARMIGMDQDEFASQVLAPKSVEGYAPEDPSRTFGYSKKVEIDGLIKTAIGIGPNANASTALHELTHGIWTFLQANRSNEKIEAFLTEAETAFQIQNKDWKADWSGWTDEYKKTAGETANRSGEEAVAYALEDYLAFGRAKTPEQEGILARLGQLIVELYNGLKAARVQLSPEITAFFDKVMTESPIAEEMKLETEQEATGIKPASEMGTEATKQAANESGVKLPGNSPSDAVAVAQERQEAKGKVPETVAGELDIFQGVASPNMAENTRALDAAKELERAGTDTQTIYEQTGWKKVRGAWMHEPSFQKKASPQVLYQGKTGSLAVLHNIDAEKIATTNDFGGLPMPSLAITKPEIDFTQFGDSTLIADPKVAQRAMNEGRLFDRDIWSPTVPEPEWKIDEKKLSSINSKLLAAGKKLGRYFSLQSLNTSDITGGADRLVGSLSYNDEAKYAFLQDIGEAPEIVISQKEPPAPKAVVEAVKNFIDSDKYNIDTEEEDLAKLIRSVLESDPKKAAKSIRPQILAFWSSPKKITEIRTYIRNTRENDFEPDYYATVDLVDAKIKEKGEAFTEWLKSQVSPAYSNPRIKIGREKIQFNAYSVLEWMQSKATQGSQEHLTFGPKKAASLAGRAFETREDLRAKEGTLVSQEEAAKAWEEKVEPLTEKIQEQMPKYYKYRDTWDALNSIYMALGRYFKGGVEKPSPERMRRSLSAELFSNVPTDLVQTMVELAQEMVKAPQDYFEAKPDRVLQLSDFKAAVIPAKASEKTKQTIRDSGLQVFEYSSSEERGNVVRAAIDQLGDVLFQGEADRQKIVASDDELEPIRNQSINNTDTQEFRSWFAKSKVVNERGEPLVVYHGSPNAGFASFNEGISYFSPSAEYAAAYTHSGVSAITKQGKVNNDSPAIYPVYLSMQKPFDTRQKRELEIFRNEFLGKWGNGTPLDPERGLPDWTDAQDLKEFFEEKGYDYDGLILAESHGKITYAVFSPAQIKSVFNRGTWDIEDTNILFQGFNGLQGEGNYNTGASIQKLLQEKDGYFERAGFIPGIGDIMIPWGWTGTEDRNFENGYGIAKIVRKHEDTDSVLAALPDIFENGRVMDDPYRDNRKWVIWQNYKAVIALDREGKEGAWLLTAYIPESWRDQNNPPTGPASIGAQDPQAQETGPQVSADTQTVPRRRMVVKAIHRAVTEQEDAVQKERLYQGEAEPIENVNNIRKAAQEAIESGESFDDFTTYFETFEDQEKWGIPDLKAEQKRAWYKSQWDAALKPDAEPSLADWVKSLSDEGHQGLKNFLRMVWTEVLQKENQKPEPGSDPEEIMQILAEKDRASGLREEIAEPIIAGALAIGPKNKPLSPSYLASVYGIIKANPEEYARIYGEISGDEKIGALGKKEEAKKYADIEDPRLEKAMGISERAELASKIRDEKLSRAIRSGDIAMDDDTRGYVKNVEQGLKRSKREIEKLTKDIAESEAEIDSQGRQIGQLRAELSKYNKETDKIISRTMEYLDANADIPPILESQRTQIEQRREAIRAKLVAAKDWTEIDRQIKEAQNRIDTAQAEIDKAHARGEAPELSIVEARSRARSKLESLQAQLPAAKLYSNAQGLQTYLAKLEERTKLQDEYRERMAEQRALREVREYRKKLIRQTMKPAADSSNVKYKTAISNIQAILKQKYPKDMEEDARAAAESSLSSLVARITSDPAISQVVSRDFLTGLIGKRQSQLTLQDVEGVHQKIQSLRKIGREVQSAIVEERMMKSEELKNSIGNKLESLPGYKPETGTDTTKKVSQKWQERIRSIDYAWKNARRFLRDMDGGTDGTNVELAWNQMNRLYRQEQEQIDTRQAKILKAIRDAGHDPQEWFDQIVTIPEVGKNGGEAVLRKSDLMGMALAFRNEDSRQAVIYGKFFSEAEKSQWRDFAAQNKELAYDYAEEAGLRKLQALNAAIDATLDASDWNIIDSIFEADGKETAGRLAKVVADVENRELLTIDHYFPLIRKGVGDQQLAQQTAGDVLDRTSGLRRPPKNGFTKERIQIAPWNQRDVETDLLTTWLKSIERQEHYISFAQYGKQLDSVYLDNLVQEQIKGKFGQAGVDYMKDYITEIKNPSEMSRGNAAESAIKYLRGNLGAAYLAYRTSSVLKQVVTSPWPALPYAGPRLFGEAVKMMANPVRYLRETEEMSIVLRKRSFDMVYDALKNSDANSEIGKFAKNAEILGMKGLEYADRFSVAIGWRAIYEKTLAETGDSQKAMEKADDIVLMTQPTSRGVDLAPAYRGKNPSLQIVLQFTQALNVVYQNLRYDLPNAIKQHDIKTAVGISVAYIVSGCLLQALVSKPPEKDEDPKKAAARWAFYAISQGTDSIPLLGEEVTRIAKRAITGETTYKFSDNALPGIAQFLDGMYSLAGDDLDAAAEKVLRGVGTLGGAPVSGINELSRALSGDVGALVGRPKADQ